MFLGGGLIVLLRALGLSLETRCGLVAGSHLLATQNALGRCRRFWLVKRLGSASEVTGLQVATELMPFLVGSDNLSYNSDRRSRVKVADPCYR